MREIEFRAKRKDDRKWMYGSLQIDGEYVAIKEQGRAWPNALYCTVDGETVGQYTGLKDKNGVKIFEGDIVRSLHYVTGVKRHKHFLYHIIEWSENYTGWISINISELNKEKRTGSPPLWVYKNNCEFEVIGNIHDNPELLECE